MKQNNFIPFSKKNIIYARLEAYAFSLILIVLVLLNKDVSAIAVLLSLAWGGYKTLQCYYIWLCKHEHIMDKKIEYQKLNLDTTDLDYELNNIENDNFESEVS